jgi:LmbE family N-acetylglucosaminyl deacetylase
MVNMNNEVRLVLTPHMDDEVIGMGGTIANLVKSGYQVVVVYLTDGAAAYEGNVSETKTILLKAQVGSGRGLRRSGVR